MGRVGVGPAGGQRGPCWGISVAVDDGQGDARRAFGQVRSDDRAQNLVEVLGGVEGGAQRVEAFRVAAGLFCLIE